MTSLVLQWRPPPPQPLAQWSPQPGQPPSVAALVGPRGANGVMYSEVIGDGVSTVFHVEHNLMTRDVAVNIYALAGDQPDVIADVYRPPGDVNQIRIEFHDPPALAEFRVVVIGVGP